MENVIAILGILKKVNVTKAMLHPYGFSLPWVEHFTKF